VADREARRIQAIFNCENRRLFLEKRGPTIFNAMNDQPFASVSVTTRNTVSLTLGIVSIVVGVIALLIGWVPFLGLFAIPIAIIGVLMAGAGFLFAVIKKGKGLGLPIVGGLICIAGLIVPILSTGGVSTAFQRAIQEARNKDTSDAKVTVVEKPGDSNRPSAAKANSKAEKPEPKITWNDASKPLRIGDVQVEIKTLKVGPVHLKDMFGEAKISTDSLLMINVEVTNLSAGKKLDFKTWRGEQFSFDKTFASLTDDNDNTYKRINFGSTVKIDPSVDIASVYPGKGVTDVLVFESPVETAKWLHLELPAKNFNGEGVVRFDIPAAMITR
jgi:hypothetical protein